MFSGCPKLDMQTFTSFDAKIASLYEIYKFYIIRIFLSPAMWEVKNLNASSSVIIFMLSCINRKLCMAIGHWGQLENIYLRNVAFWKNFDLAE